MKKNQAERSALARPRDQTRESDTVYRYDTRVNDHAHETRRSFTNALGTLWHIRVAPLALRSYPSQL